MGKSGLFQGSEAIAEAARDKAAYTGFIAGLFEADVRWHLFTSISIPTVTPAALDFLEGLKPLLLSLDPDRVDSEGELPESVIKSLANLGALGIKTPNPVISTSGRVVIDPQKKLITYVGEDVKTQGFDPDLAARRANPFALERARFYEFGADGMLTLTSRYDNGKEAAVGRWKKSS